MILVTGASGNVGGYVCQALAEVGSDFVRAVSTHTTHENERTLDFLNAHTFTEALSGVQKVFLVRPPALSKPEQDMRPFIEACQQAGVQQLVFLSLQGVEQNTFTPHAKIEGIIRRVGVPYTFLRPSFFMQNLTMQHAAEIRQRDELFMPAGNGKTNFIDARDIADAAATVLLSSDHLFKAYELTGADSFSYYEVAGMLTSELNRTIRYTKPGLLRYWLRSLKQGMPFGFALVTGVIYSIARLGKASGKSEDLILLLGRPPRSLPAFIQEHKQYWLKT